MLGGVCVPASPVYFQSRSDMFIADESLRSRHSVRSAMLGASTFRSWRSEDNIKLSTSINISLLRSEDKSLAKNTSKEIPRGRTPDADET